jgi:hypothetical protein
VHTYDEYENEGEIQRGDLVPIEPERLNQWSQIYNNM